METTYKYKAFISYSHQDQKFGKWLHRKIENYKIPKSLRQKYPNLPKDLKRTLFIDDEELPTASALPDNLSNALESSELLIVVCSPSATQSYWVDKEIAYFKQYHGEGKVLAVLKEGEPNATYSSVYDNILEAFPKSLRYKIDANGIATEERIEPLAADARKRTSRKKALIKLIAGILKVDFADLWEREKRETRKRRVIYGSLLAMFIAVSIYASVQFLGEQGNKELEQINHKIATIEYSIRHDELPVEKVIALNKELKKLKVDKENKEASQEALGKLNTSLGKKAKRVYQKEGAKAAIKILTSKSALANQESRLKDVSKEKLALAKLYVETYEFDIAEENYRKATELFFDYENALEYGVYLHRQNNFQSAIQILKELEKQNLISDQMANVHIRLAALYDNIRLYSDAILEYKQVLDLNASVDNISLSSLALAYHGIANAYAMTNKLRDAENSYKKTLELYRDLTRDDFHIYSSAYAYTLTNAGRFYSRIHEYKESEDTIDEAIHIYRSLVKNDPEAYSPNLAFSLDSLSNLYAVTNRLVDSEKVSNEAIKIYRSLVKNNPEQYNPYFAMALNNLAITYTEINKLDLAQKIYIEAIKIYRDLAQENPDAYNSDLAFTLNNLGVLYSDNKQFNKAEEVYVEALTKYYLLVKTNSNAFNPGLASTLNNLGFLYFKTKQFKKAEKMYKNAARIYRTLVEANPTIYKPELERTLNNLHSLSLDN